MDLKRIEYLMHVAELGSFSKAATIVGISQPALGRLVQKLEQDCGLQLLYRNGRGVSLTSEGEQFIERIRPLMQQLKAVPSDLQDERTSPTGQVTVGLTPTVCDLLGMALVIAVRQKYPKLQVNIVSGYSGYIHEWLINSRLDLAVLHDARRSQHVAVEHLGYAALSLVSPPALLSSAESAASSVTLRQLDGLPLVLPTNNHGLRRTLELSASQANLKLNVQYEVDTLSLMKEIVLAGLAHTVLAIPAVQSEVENGRLIARRLYEPTVETRLVLAKCSNRPLNRAIRLVEQEIKHTFHQVLQKASLDLDLSVASQSIFSPTGSLTAHP